jgi:K+-transporting ATPase KdpF subunit
MSWEDALGLLISLGLLLYLLRAMLRAEKVD